MAVQENVSSTGFGGVYLGPCTDLIGSSQQQQPSGSAVTGASSPPDTERQIEEVKKSRSPTRTSLRRRPTKEIQPEVKGGRNARFVVRHCVFLTQS